MKLEKDKIDQGLFVAKVEVESELFLKELMAFKILQHVNIDLFPKKSVCSIMLDTIGGNDMYALIIYFEDIIAPKKLRAWNRMENRDIQISMGDQKPFFEKTISSTHSILKTVDVDYVELNLLGKEVFPTT